MRRWRHVRCLTGRGRVSIRRSRLPLVAGPPEQAQAGTAETETAPPNCWRSEVLKSRNKAMCRWIARIAPERAETNAASGTAWKRRALDGLAGGRPARPVFWEAVLSNQTNNGPWSPTPRSSGLEGAGEHTRARALWLRRSVGQREAGAASSLPACRRLPKAFGTEGATWLSRAHRRLLPDRPPTLPPR